MVRDLLAWCFRSVNANLVKAQGPLFKLLKGTQWLSRVAYKRWGYPQSRWITITNFDQDIRIRIDPSRPIGGAIFWTGFHEFREMVFLHRYLSPEMVLVDVGANLGEFTLFAAKRLKKGRVIAYEPLPLMVDQLLQDIVLNDFSHITVVPCGLAESERSVPLFTPVSSDDNEGLATLYAEESSAASVMIDLKTLDAEAEKLKLNRLDVITMDIEGAELFALRGAAKVLRKFRPLVIIEINQKTFSAAGYTVQDIARFFQELQYSPFELDKECSLRPVPELPMFGNVIFKPIL